MVAVNEDKSRRCTVKTAKIVKIGALSARQAVGQLGPTRADLREIGEVRPLPL